ncbi:MAG: hypothetical protein ACERKD_24805 [Prolixibacteraceae bacterium]
MEDHQHCEVFGTLEKLEQFNTIHQNIIPGSLVFESPAPFWGYYNEFNSPLTDHCPHYVYIAILTTHEVFDVVRAFQKVRAEFDFDLDAAKAFIKFNDRFYNVIRLRHIDDYARIKDVQESFAKHGISMLFTPGNWQNVNTHVTLKKVFCLQSLTDAIYKDACEGNHYYLKIPKKLTFEEFAEVTAKVRHNWLGSKFDAALGCFLKEQEVVDIVRIYSGILELSDLEEIQKLYWKKIY